MTPSRFFRTTVLVNCLVPATLLAWDAWRGHLGANPVNFAIRTTGMLSLIFLVLTLAVTPAARLSGLGWLGRFRRMMGLCAFFHAAVHFGLFYGLDRAGDFSDTLSEMVKRPYLMVGSLALALMVPLAATSTDAMIRLLGGRRWKNLHRATYVVAAAGALHYYMLVKADVRKPLAFAGAVGVLLGYRALARYRKLRNAPAAPAPRFWKGRLKVARVTQETPDIRTFRLVAPDGGRLPFSHLPGQYLNLSLPIDGRTVHRSYTIASSPARSDYCEITVKRETSGVASRQLHDAVHEGDVLDVSAPAGRFVFTGTEANAVVLIAGGVGITPLMSKVRHLTDIAWPGEIHLILAVRTADDVVFREELDDLRRRFPNLRVTVTLTRDAPSDWPGERGRITPALLERVVPRIAERRVHVCGPTLMMDEVEAMLRGLGVPADQIHRESFMRPGGEPGALLDPEAAVAKAGPTSVTFAQSGRSKSVAAGETVLEAAEEIGIDLPYDCRAGVCGTCKTRLVSGRVRMDVDVALEPADRDGGLILACQAVCLDEVVVDA